MSTPTADVVAEIRAKMELDKLEAEIDEYIRQNRRKIAIMATGVDPEAPPPPPPPKSPYEVFMDRFPKNDFISREVAHFQYMHGDLLPPPPRDPEPEPQDPIRQTMLAYYKRRGEIE